MVLKLTLVYTGKYGMFSGKKRADFTIYEISTDQNKQKIISDLTTLFRDKQFRRDCYVTKPLSSTPFYSWLVYTYETKQFEKLVEYITRTLPGVEIKLKIVIPNGKNRFVNKGVEIFDYHIDADGTTEFVSKEIDMIPTSRLDPNVTVLLCN